MEAVILSLMLWLKDTTTFKVPEVPPPFEIVARTTIAAYANSKQTSPSDSVIAQPLALCFNKKLYLSKELDSNKLIDKSIVLHELVHYIQNGCISNNHSEFFEMQAYAVQKYWLKQNGIDMNFRGRRPAEDDSSTDILIPLKNKGYESKNFKCYSSCPQLEK